MGVATAPSYNSGISRSRPGFGSVVRSEWTKMRSVRSTWIIVGLLLLLSIGFSALISFVTGLTYQDWGPAEQASFDPVINSLVGVLFAMVLLIVLGVTTATSEYGSKMIRTTFIVTPNRNQVFLAKVVIVGVMGMVLGTLALLGMFLVSQAIFSAYGVETAALSDNDVQRMMITYFLAFGPVYTLIALAIGFLLRGTASAITASIGLFFLPWMFAPLLPSWVQENVVRFLADSALDSLAGITAADAATYLSQGPAIAVIVAWIAMALVFALFMLNRRDA